MPYKEIQSDEAVYEVYLSYLEKGIREVFDKYNISQIDLNVIFSNARKKVIGNPEYLYHEQ